MKRLAAALGIFVVALGLRLWVLDGMEAYPRFELIKNRLDDQVTFHFWARALADGRPFLYAETEHELAHWAAARPGVYAQAPLYPTALSALYRLGFEIEHVRILQAVLGGATASLIFLSAAFFVPLPTASAIGLAAAAYGPWVFYDCTYLRVGPINFLTALSLWLMLLCQSAWAEKVSAETRRPRGWGRRRVSPWPPARSCELISWSLLSLG